MIAKGFIEYHYNTVITLRVCHVFVLCTHTQTLKYSSIRIPLLYLRIIQYLSVSLPLLNLHLQLVDSQEDSLLIVNSSWKVELVRLWLFACYCSSGTSGTALFGPLSSRRSKYTITITATSTGGETRTLSRKFRLGTTLFMVTVMVSVLEALIFYVHRDERSMRCSSHQWRSGCWQWHCDNNGASDWAIIWKQTDWSPAYLSSWQSWSFPEL